MAHNRYPSKSSAHLFLYGHADPLAFSKIAQRFVRADYKYAWCLWRKELPDTTHEYNKIIGDVYLPIPKWELAKDISQSFADHHINYIVPVGAWRIYASFNDEEEMHDPFYYIMDSITVIQKHEIFEFTDHWGLYHETR